MTNRGLLNGLGTGPLRLDNKRVTHAADPIDPQDVVTKNWARGSNAMTPYYFPPTAQGEWDPLNSMYGWGSGDLHLVRAKMKKLATAVAPMHVFFIGDSTLMGYNGTAVNTDRAIPRQFGLAMSYMLGGIPYTDGVRQANVATATLSDRMALTGGFNTALATNSNLLACAGAGTAKWSSLDRGTTLEFYYSDLSTSGFTYSIDGAGAVSVTTTGTSTVKMKQITGLSDAPHNVLITTTTGNTWIVGFRVYSPALTQLHCHNLSIGGTQANGGSAVGYNWSNATATGLQGTTVAMMGAGAANVTPDLVVCCCGNNDAQAANSREAQEIIQGIQNMRGIWPTTPFIFMHPPMVTGSDPTLFDNFSRQIITMIDGMSQATYFSWDDWDNRSASFNADGLAGADGNHPIDAEAMAVARHLATQLAGPETYSTPLTAMATIADVTTSGTSEQIVFQNVIPSWFWKAGVVAKVVMSGTCTSGTTPVLTATHSRIGTAGTTSDASVCATATTATITAGAGWHYEAEFTCRSAGSSGTVFGKATLMVNGIAIVISAETTAATVDTTKSGYLTVTLTPGGTTPVFVVRQAFIDVPLAP